MSCGRHPQWLHAAEDCPMCAPPTLADLGAVLGELIDLVPLHTFNVEQLGLMHAALLRDHVTAPDQSTTAIHFRRLLIARIDRRLRCPGCGTAHRPGHGCLALSPRGDDRSETTPES